MNKWQWQYEKNILNSLQGTAAPLRFKGLLHDSLSQRVDLCTEAFGHLLGTFGLGNAWKHFGHFQKPDCGQKVMGGVFH